MKVVRDIFEYQDSLGFFQACKGILTCPWCFGIWAVLIIITLYYLVPYADFLVILLALAGVASIFQVSINAIGWIAEKNKKQVKK